MTPTIKAVRHLILDVQITEDDQSIQVTRVALVNIPPQRLQNGTRIPFKTEQAPFGGPRFWTIYDDTGLKLVMEEHT